jgi:hypothetical protein
MTEYYELVRQHGRDRARDLVKLEERRLVDIAAEVLADARGAAGYTYSGFCMTSLPHRSIPDGEKWKRVGERFTLIVEPGTVYNAAGAERTIGVPFGPKARLLLLYLQSEAILSGSQTIDMGASMHVWLNRMGLTRGGKTYKMLREQAARLSACRLVFVKGDGITDGKQRSINLHTRFVDGSILLGDPADPCQGTLWADTVRITDAFYKELKKEPVLVHDGAVRALAEKSHALDVYCWLAYRLHSLERPTPVTWESLYDQFGATYKHIRQFKPRFIDSLKEALAAYEQAKVETDGNGRGLILHPSHPPALKAIRG